LKDVTAVGVLGGSGGLAGIIERYAVGAVDRRPQVAVTIGRRSRSPSALTRWPPSSRMTAAPEWAIRRRSTSTRADRSAEPRSTLADLRRL
jgi:hypothetical protein